MLAMFVHLIISFRSRTSRISHSCFPIVPKYTQETHAHFSQDYSIYIYFGCLLYALLYALLLVRQCEMVLVPENWYSNGPNMQRE